MIVFYVKLYSAVISQQSVVSSHYLLVTSHVSLATSRISLSTVQQIRYITNLLQNERIVLESAMSSWNCWENPSKCLPRFSKQKYPINMWFWNCIIQKRMHGLVGQGTRHKTQSEKRYAIKWLNTCCILCGIHPNLVDSRRRSWLRQWHSGGVEDLDHRYPLNLFLN